MTDFQGKHVWFELNTTDLKAAEAFYASVIGWVPRDAGMPDMQYTMIGPAEYAVGGMMALTDEMTAGGASPGWIGYVAVDDGTARPRGSGTWVAGCSCRRRTSRASAASRS